MKQITDEKTVIKALIKLRDLTPKYDENGRDAIYCANHAEFGCRGNFYVNERNDEVYVPAVTLWDDGKIYCRNCSSCRVCSKSIKPQFLRSPGENYSYVFGGRTTGGLCRPCWKKIKIARTEWDEPTRVYTENKMKPIGSLKSLSTGYYKLMGYARLQHEKDPYRVFEIGYFNVMNNAQGVGCDNDNDLVRLTQIGTTCTTKRGKNIQVWKERRKQVHPNWGDADDFINNSRYMGVTFSYYEDNIMRVIDYMRGLGYKPVERKDGRNGRKVNVGSDLQYSKATVKLNEQKDDLDEALGEKHQEKLEKIDMKYRRADYAPDWIAEPTR